MASAVAVCCCHTMLAAVASSGKQPVVCGNSSGSSNSPQTGLSWLLLSRLLLGSAPCRHKCGARYVSMIPHFYLLKLSVSTAI